MRGRKERAARKEEAHAATKVQAISRGRKGRTKAGGKRAAVSASSAADASSAGAGAATAGAGVAGEGAADAMVLSLPCSDGTVAVTLELPPPSLTLTLPCSDGNLELSLALEAEEEEEPAYCITLFVETSDGPLRMRLYAE